MGIHTPETDQEKDLDKVKKKIKEFVLALEAEGGRKDKK